MNLWSRLGVSVAIAAIFCIAATELLPFCGGYKWHICATFFSAGAILWIVGRGLNAKAAKLKPLEDLSEDSDTGQRFLLGTLTYWGPMLIVLGLLLLFIDPVRSVRAVAARSAPNPIAAASQAVTNALPSPKVAPTATNRPVVFPTLRLQGLIYRQPNPSALINGRTFFMGDYVGDAKVILIDTERVVLEQEGYYKVLAWKN